MKERFELLKDAFRRISDNRDFIGYYLKKYCEFENITDQELAKKFNWAFEDYFRLGLCITPDQSSLDFIDRIDKISEYTHLSSLVIVTIIKHVAAIEHFNDISSDSMLLAARQNDKKKNDETK
jgi:hypothetical protein